MTPPPLPTHRALSLGLSTALSLAPVVLLRFAAGVVELLGGALAAGSMLGWLSGRPQASVALLGGGLCAWLLSRLGSTVVAGGGLLQADARLSGCERVGLWAAVLRSSRRSLSFFLWWLPAELGWLGASWLGWVASTVLYASALASGERGLSGSLALAAWLPMAMLMALFGVLWGRLGRVRSVARDVGAASSLFEAAGALARRPWPYLGASLAVAVLTAVAQGALSPLVSSFSGAPGAPPPWALTVAGQWVLGVLTAYLAAVAEQAIDSAFLALDLDGRGRLLVPPARAPAVGASPIIDALPVPPRGSTLV